MTTSRPAASSRRAASSMAKALPTPGHMPRKTLSLSRLCAGSARFDVTDDHVAPGGQFASRGLEHGEGLAHAGAHAEKNLKLAAFLRGFLALERTQQHIRIGAVAAVHEFILTNP